MSSSAPNIAVFAPVLRSPRLTMTLFNRETDLQFLLDLFNASRSQLPTDPPLKEEDILRLNRNFTLSPKNCLGLTPTDVASYTVHLGDENGEKIGHIVLSERHPDIPPDIGYAIIPSHRRQGYATEAAITVKNYWISFGFKEITGFCLPDNEPSNKLIMKMGFERGGEALANGAIVVNAYVLPGMKHCTVETTRFNRMGVDKD